MINLCSNLLLGYRICRQISIGNIKNFFILHSNFLNRSSQSFNPYFEIFSMIRKYVRQQLYKHRSQRKIANSIYQKYCSLTGFLHVLPDFLIIGFPKCGTTSLYEYLIQHPSIHSPIGTEEFF